MIAEQRANRTKAGCTFPLNSKSGRTSFPDLVAASFFPSVLISET